jgi:AAA family ATP:ADP antiporter
MALYFFLAMACGSIVKSLQIALYLSKVGFDWRLPSLYAVVALICGLIVLLHRYLARRYSNLDLASGTLGFFQLSIVLFWFLVAREQVWVYLAFYIWGGIFCLLVPTLGWFIAFDLYSTREAKRLFALFGTGGILGGAFGGYYTALVSRTLGASGLLVHVFVLLLVLQGVLLAIYRSTGNRVELRHPLSSDTYKQSRSAHPSSLTGLLGSRYFTSLAGMVLLCAFTTTLIDLQYQWFLEQRYPGSETQITQFVSALLGIMYSFSALLQLFATSRLLAHLGVGTTLLVLPLALFGGSLGALILAGFTAAVALKAIDGFLRPSIYRIGLEVLYVPFSGPHTLTLKSFIDLVVFRFGDALGAAAFLGVSIVLVTPVEILQATILLAAALWVFLTLQLRQQYVNRLRYSLEHKPPKAWPSSLMLEATGAQEALQAALKSDNPSKLSFALQQLTAADLQNEEVQVMDFSASVEDIMHTHISGVHSVRQLWLKTVAHLVDHSDPQIGAVAFHLLVRHDPAKYSSHLGKKLDSESIPKAIYLYYLDRYIEHPDPYLQFSQVMNWCQSPSPEATSILARLMGKTRNRAFLPILRQWMSGLPGEPARAAIEAIGQYAEPRLLVPLISLLGSHWSRQAARKALINYGEPAVSQLLEFLRNPAIGSSVKQQIPHILSRINTSSSREGLVSALYSPDPAVSYNSLKGLNKLRASQDFSYSQQTFLPLLQIWAKQYYELVNIESISNKQEEDAWKLLRKTNHERIDWTIEKIFRSLELFFPRGEAYLSYLGYTGNKKKLRENAIELIDVRIRGELRKTLLPIFSQDSPAKVTRKGRALFRLPSDPDAILLDALSELDPWLRCCVMAALREQPRPILERAVRQASQDIDPLVRETAQWVLRSMKGAASGTEEGRVMLPTIEKVLLLQDLGILSFASTDHLAQLATLCQANTYPADETLFRKGEPHSELFLLVEGRVSLETEANPETVEKCALDFWSCLAQSAHEVSAKCVDDCTVLLVSVEDLVDILSSEPDLSWAILKYLASSRPKP